MGRGKEIMLLFLQILLLVAPIISAQPAIIRAPESVRVGLGHDPVQLTCTVRGENIFWRINGILYDYNSFNMFEQRGITVSSPAYNGNEITEILTASITITNNNTNMVCLATSVDFNASSSNISTIFIADVPLPPSPVFVGIDGDTIGLEWKVPFTWEDFPILGYTLEVVNQTNSTVLDITTMTPDILSYNLTRVSPLSCTNLTFRLLANNSLGYSDPGTTHGAFPDVPGEFLDSPRTEVTYSKTQSPILEVDFTFPSLCPYHNATYLVVIEDEAGALIHTIGPHIRHWTQSGSMVTMEIREGGLAIDTNYVVNITVSTIVGVESIVLSFNTTPCCSATTPSTPFPPTISSGLSPPAPPTNVVLLVGVSLGTLFLVLIVTVISIAIIITITYNYKRSIKRKRDCHNTTDIGSTSIAVRPMVTNPIYEGMAIYEEIPGACKSLPDNTHEREEGYVSITTGSLLNKDCFTMDGHIQGGMDEIYTKMDSVGTLMGQLRGGAAAGSTTEHAPSLGVAYSHACPDEGASAKSVFPVPEEDERYVTLK